MGKNKEIPLWDLNCYNISTHFLTYQKYKHKSFCRHKKRQSLLNIQENLLIICMNFRAPYLGQSVRCAVFGQLKTKGARFTFKKFRKWTYVCLIIRRYVLINNKRSNKNCHSSVMFVPISITLSCTLYIWDVNYAKKIFV